MQLILYFLIYLFVIFDYTYVNSRGVYMSEEEKIIKGILENEYSNEVEKVESADSEVNKEEVVVSTKENTEKNNKKIKIKRLLLLF